MLDRLRMLAKGELQCSRGIRRQSQANLQTPVPLFSLAATLQKYLYLFTIFGVCEGLPGVQGTVRQADLSG